MDEALDSLVTDADTADAYGVSPASSTSESGSSTDGPPPSPLPDDIEEHPDTLREGVQENFANSQQDIRDAQERWRQEKIASFGAGQGETRAEIEADIARYNADPSSFSLTEAHKLKSRIYWWNKSQEMHDRNLTELNVAHSLGGTDTPLSIQNELVENLLSGDEARIGDAQQDIKDINTLHYGEQLAAFDQAAFEASKVIPTLDIPSEQGNALYSDLLGTDPEAKAKAFDTLAELVDAHNENIDSSNRASAASAVETLAELDIPEDVKGRLVAGLQSEDADTLYNALVDYNALVGNHNRALEAESGSGDDIPEGLSSGQEPEETLRILAYPDDIPEGDKEWITISLTAFREDLAAAGYSEAQINQRVKALEERRDWEEYIESPVAAQPPVLALHPETDDWMTDEEAETAGRRTGFTFSEEAGVRLPDQEVRRPGRNEGVIPPTCLRRLPRMKRRGRPCPK